MPWVRFDDKYLQNEKLRTLPTEAIALDVAAIIHSASKLLDGHLTFRDIQVVAGLIGMRRWRPFGQQLVRVGRWEDEPGGIAIHDYPQYQPLREKVLAERAAAAERKRAKSPAGRPGRRDEPDSGAHPVNPGRPSGTTDAPPSPPRRARGATKNGRDLSTQDEADLAAMQAHAVLAGARS